MIAPVVAADLHFYLTTSISPNSTQPVLFTLGPGRARTRFGSHLPVYRNISAPLSNADGVVQLCEARFFNADLWKKGVLKYDLLMSLPQIVDVDYLADGEDT
jgi:hypothetical protein